MANNEYEKLFWAKEDSLYDDWNFESRGIFISIGVDLTPAGFEDVSNILKAKNPLMSEQEISGMYDFDEINIVVESKYKSGLGDIHFEIYNKKTEQYEEIALSEDIREKIKENLKAEGRTELLTTNCASLTDEEMQILEGYQKINDAALDIADRTEAAIKRVEKSSAESRKETSDTARAHSKKSPRKQAPTTDEVKEDIAEQAFEDLGKTADELKKTSELAKKILANVQKIAEETIKDIPEKKTAKTSNRTVEAEKEPEQSPVAKIAEKAKRSLFESQERKASKAIIDSAKKVISLTGVTKFVSKLVDKIKDTKASELISDLIHFSKAKETDNVKSYGNTISYTARKICEQLEQLRELKPDLVPEDLITRGKNIYDQAIEDISVKDFNVFMKDVENFVGHKDKNSTLFFNVPREFDVGLEKIKETLDKKSKSLEKKKDNLSEETQQILEGGKTIRETVEEIKNSYKKPKVSQKKDPKKEQKIEREGKRYEEQGISFTQEERKIISENLSAINRAIGRISGIQKDQMGTRGYDNMLAANLKALSGINGKSSLASYCNQVGAMLDTGIGHAAAQYAPVAAGNIKNEFKKISVSLGKIQELMKDEYERRNPPEKAVKQKKIKRNIEEMSFD